MVFDFIKRLFSGNNIQNDSIVMTDPKDLEITSPKNISFFDCKKELIRKYIPERQQKAITHDIIYSNLIIQDSDKQYKVGIKLTDYCWEYRYPSTINFILHEDVKSDGSYISIMDPDICRIVVNNFDQVSESLKDISIQLDTKIKERSKQLECFDKCKLSLWNKLQEN